MMRRFGKRLKQLRNDRGLTQDDMMEFGFARRRYQEIEAGLQAISYRTGYRLARALDVSFEELNEGIDPR